MNRKRIIGLAVVVCLAVFSLSVIAFADDNDVTSTGLQEGEDSPGVHQCPRDGYDVQEGPAYRDGFGDDF